MKLVFFSFPVHGHTNPSLPVVSELCRRGASVVYYSVPAFRDRVLHTGAEYREYTGPFEQGFQRATERLPELPELLMTATDEVLRKEADRVMSDRPQVVLHDSVAPWGKCVARRLKRPSVCSISTFAFDRKVAMMARGVYRVPRSWERMRRKLRSILKAQRVARRIRREFGVRPTLTDLIYASGDLNIVYTSRAFQPCEHRFGEDYRFVGPSLHERPEANDFPWEAVGGRPLIYVSMGTLFNDESRFYQDCFDVLGQLDVQVVLSSGGGLGHRERDVAPENFIVRDYVPQLEVLQRADLAITRGGMNTVSECLNAGVPMIVIPYLAEQSVVARRLAEVGTGILLKREQVGPTTIGKAVQTILANPEYRRNCDRIATTFREAGGAVRAAQEVLSFALRTPPT